MAINLQLAVHVDAKGTHILEGGTHPSLVHTVYLILAIAQLAQSESVA
jgi:hypothetical protein